MNFILNLILMKKQQRKHFISHSYIFLSYFHFSILFNYVFLSFVSFNFIFSLSLIFFLISLITKLHLQLLSLTTMCLFESGFPKDIISKAIEWKHKVIY
jgi:hypothetical protein